MLSSFFGRRTKTVVCGSTLAAVGTCFLTNSLNAAAINVQTKSEGFVKSKIFGYLKNRVDEKDVETIEKNWNWGKDSILTFLEKSHIFFDATNGDKTRLEKWLALLKFAEKYCSKSDANVGNATYLKNQILKLIDMNSGELLAEYFDTKSIEDLLEIGKLDLLYKKTINEDKERRYKRLLSFTELSNNRVVEYCSDLLAFCNFEGKNDEQMLSEKLFSAKALSECFCYIFDFRTDSKDAFMCYKQFMHMISCSLKILSFNLSENFKNSFVKDLLIALNSAFGNLNKSETAGNILKHVMLSYNKAGMEGLKKMLNFWSKKNDNGFLNDTISKEIQEKKNNGEGLKKEIDKKVLDELFKQADDLVKNF